MVRRPIEDDEDNSERWLVSYADFITLLFAFFVVMYSVSSVNQSKYIKVSSSINSAFSKSKSNDTNANHASNSQSAANAQVEPPIPADPANQVKKQEMETMAELGQTLSAILSPLIKAGNARVVQNNLGLRIDIKDKVLFTAGSAALTEAARDLIKSIAMPLTLQGYAILVEGHTDNTPIYIQNASFFSSWELAAVRASSVTTVLHESGIENLRLSALGYGPSQPVADNMTENGRAINRHMAIMVLYNSLSSNDRSEIEIIPDTK